MDDRLKQLQDDYAQIGQDIEAMAQQRLRIEGAIAMLRELISNEKQEQPTE